MRLPFMLFVMMKSVVVLIANISFNREEILANRQVSVRCRRRTGLGVEVMLRHGRPEYLSTKTARFFRSEKRTERNFFRFKPHETE